MLLSLNRSAVFRKSKMKYWAMSYLESDSMDALHFIRSVINGSTTPLQVPPPAAAPTLAEGWILASL